MFLWGVVGVKFVVGIEDAALGGVCDRAPVSGMAVGMVLSNSSDRRRDE